MTVVSIRDFRANQSKYLGLAAGGESVILTSRTGSFKIGPVTEDVGLGNLDFETDALWTTKNYNRQ